MFSHSGCNNRSKMANTSRREVGLTDAKQQRREKQEDYLAETERRREKTWPALDCTASS